MRMRAKPDDETKSVFCMCLNAGGGEGRGVGGWGEQGVAKLANFDAKERRVIRTNEHNPKETSGVLQGKHKRVFGVGH